MMGKVKHEIKRVIFWAYSRLKHPAFFWRLLNRKPIDLFRKNKPDLGVHQKRILETLKADGIATTTLEELFPGENILETLRKYAAKPRSHARTNNKKTFLLDYFDECPKLTLKNPFVRLAFDARILNIVNTYMDMLSRLLYLSLQETIPSDPSRSYSRSWHRDPQERRLCKVFVYLNDVDEDGGPFVYVKKSVLGKQYGHLFPQQPPAGSYPDPSAVAKAIPERDQTPMTGKAGTVIFCDTTGLHYGGDSKTASRLMSTFVYAAPSYRENRSYTYDHSLSKELKRESTTAHFALKPAWMCSKN